MNIIDFKPNLTVKVLYEDDHNGQSVTTKNIDEFGDVEVECKDGTTELYHAFWLGRIN